MIGPEIDLVTGEIGTAKIIDLVYVVAKVLIMGVMTMQTKEGNQTIASAMKSPSQTMDLMNEHKSQESVAAEVEVGNEAEKVGEGNAGHEAEVDLQVKEVFQKSNLI